jgi:hypothetical protein
MNNFEASVRAKNPLIFFRRHPMRRLVAAALVVTLAGSIGALRADDKANPTGTWKWSVPGRQGGQAREMTLKLKLDGDKLTGAMVGQNGQETAIEDGQYKDGEVSFKVTRERQGNKFTIKYTGKVSGDAIKGKSEFEREGQTQSRDWEAKRAKD